MKVKLFTSCSRQRMNMCLRPFLFLRDALAPRWIQMSGKQNYKNHKISSNYTQNIFCFDVFCDFEFQNFVFGAWIVFREFVFFVSRRLCRRKMRIREKRFKHQKQNFEIQNDRKKHTNKKCFENTYFLQFLVNSRHTNY